MYVSFSKHTCSVDEVRDTVQDDQYVRYHYTMYNHTVNVQSEHSLDF